MQPYASAGSATAESMHQLDDMAERAVRRYELFTEAKREIEGLTVTERSPDGAVEVTVRSSGALIGLSCSELVRTMPPRQIAATVQHCVQTAQAGIAQRVEQILRGVAPGDPLSDELVSQARQAFAPPPAISAPPTSGPRQMAIGGIEEEGPRPQRRRAVRQRPADDHDDPDDWGGHSVMTGPRR